MADSKPDLLFLFSDQHARRVAGCYGDRHASTPALDRLSAEGVTFDNCHCPSPVCVPSRMSMLTACHPHRQACWSNDDHLASDMPTWLHALGAAGIHSELIGRMHAMGPDQLHGYAARRIGDHSPNWAARQRHAMGVLDQCNDPTEQSLINCGAGQSAYELKDRDVCDETIESLRRIAAIPADQREPFSLSVGLMLPHAPYVASEELVSHYLDTLPEPTLSAPAAGNEHPWIHWWRNNRGLPGVTPDKTALARAAYWALVSTMDAMIERILNTLDETGLADNTLVVYASDHGDHVGERGLWWKHTLYDESVTVPLIMRLPGTLAAGERHSAAVNLTDLSQTLIEAMGGQTLPLADGRSFWSQLTDRQNPCPWRSWNQPCFSEYCTDAVPAWTGGMAVQQRMLRQGDYKLHYYHGYPPLLFNLAWDPFEQQDLSGDPRHADRLRAMLAQLLEEWDPEQIRQTMLQKRQRKDVLAQWANNTQPRSTHIWPLRPDMNRLQAAQPTRKPQA